MVTCMYGGSFDPLTIGHLHCIEEALANCDKLYLILSYSKNRDRIDYKVRSSWLKQETDKLLKMQIYNDKEIIIKAVEDVESSKDTYDWENGRNNILQACEVERFDKVVCGSDYRGKGIFERLYPTSEIIYVDRDDGISSTRVMSNIYRSDNWNSIPKSVQRYFLKKVLVIGGESVGKSTMTEYFAKLYNTEFVREIGRDVSERSVDEYLMPDIDFSEILIRHKALEYEQSEKANKVLFIDTDALTTLFYTHELISDPEIRDKTDKLARSLGEMYRDTYDLIIFLDVSDTDTPFVQDGTRNENIKANRRLFSDKLRAFYDSMGYSYVIVDGTYKERYEKVKQMVDNILK